MNSLAQNNGVAAAGPTTTPVQVNDQLLGYPTFLGRATDLVKREEQQRDVEFPAHPFADGGGATMTAADAKAKIFKLVDSGNYDFGAALDCAIAAGFKDNDAKYFVYDAWREHQHRPAPVTEPVPAPIPEPPPVEILKATTLDQEPPKVIVAPEPPKPEPPKPAPAPAPEPQPPKIAAPTELPKAKPKRPTVSDEVKAERKAHKLVEDVPATLNLAIAGEWRRYPGMPDVLINVNQIAVVQKTSRRRGTFYRMLPRTAWQGREFWRHSKRGKKIVIPVKRAMFEVGFWRKPTGKKSFRAEND